MPRDEDTRFSLWSSSSSSSSKFSQQNADADEADGSTNIITKSRGLLLLVAVLYGTLNVALRGVFQQPGPPNASTLSAVRGWLASVAFIPLLLLQKKDGSTLAGSADKNEQSASSIFWPALELAIYNFGAQGLLNVGLLSVESARASFLTQLSVLITPIISYILDKQVVSKETWLGCGVAVVGVFLLSGVGLSSNGSGIATGDLFVVGGALSWSLYLFRLSKLSNLGLDEFNLQAWKTFLLAILYSIWMVVSFVSSGATNFVQTCFPGWANLLSWLALAYSAIGPGTVADILQQKAQKNVSASEANIWLSLEPVFAALFGFLLLGEGFSSMSELVGGALIVAAAFIATQGNDDSD
jgi:drug/metabolite transporter (DMT)-like permease